MKRKAMSVMSVILAAVCLLTFLPASAAALTYDEGSDSYKSGPYYQKLCEVELTNDDRINIINVARSQVGYFEGNSKSQLAGTVNGDGNYTEFGRWYDENLNEGFIHAAWCAMFVSWCAHVAGIPENIVYKHAYTPYGLDWYKNRKQAYSRAQVAAGEYTPTPGDIIYFDSTHGYGDPTNHIGIVTRYENNTIFTIEGNTSSETISTNGGTVAEKYYSIYDEYIVYICKPAYEHEENCFDIFACQDGESSDHGAIRVRGWCFDTRATSTALNLCVSIGGQITNPDAEIHTDTVANLYRPDVNNVFGCGNYHGYDTIIQTNKTGLQTVYVYAVNTKTDDRALIKSFKINIEEVQKGDVNRDGKVNNKDVVFLFRYVSLSSISYESLYDFNDDGKINNKDVVLLFRYLSK